MRGRKSTVAGVVTYPGSEFELHPGYVTRGRIDTTRQTARISRGASDCAGLRTAQGGHIRDDDRPSRGRRRAYQTVSRTLPASGRRSGHVANLAEAAKLIPQGVAALTSALAFHGLTDQSPPRSMDGREHKGLGGCARLSSYQDHRIPGRRQGIEHHKISGIGVPIFSVPKTLADAFRSKLVDRSVR